jgi:hypothetical protein
MRMVFLAVLLSAVNAISAERTFNFADVPIDQLPAGFRSCVAGSGSPGEWKVVMDDVPPLLAPISPQAPAVSKRPVLAQLARSTIDNHFPILLYEPETYGDFQLTTRFKAVGGALEQMAGVVFRFQNESNFYVVRTSVLGKNFRFYKVTNGQLNPPIGPEIEIAKGEWHEITVKCTGNQIHCLLDGKEIIPMLTDNSFAKGKIGFWTKSDSVSYFSDARITYTPQEMLAETLVKDAVKEYPRVLGITVFAHRGKVGGPTIVASTDQSEVGKSGDKAEEDVLQNARSYIQKGKGSVAVTLPLRDRNGDPVAAVRVTLRTFPGQTEENAVVRAQPIVRRMQDQVQSGDQLVE